MFLESFMLWNGNSSPKNIGLTIVGYLYKRGIEKNDMGYACAVGMVLLVIALAINVVQLVATGTFKKEEKSIWQKQQFSQKQWNQIIKLRLYYPQGFSLSSVC